MCVLPAGLPRSGSSSHWSQCVTLPPPHHTQYDWDGFSQILVDQELIVIIIENRVMTWKVALANGCKYQPNKSNTSMPSSMSPPRDIILMHVPEQYEVSISWFQHLSEIKLELVPGKPNFGNTIVDILPTVSMKPLLVNNIHGSRHVQISLISGVSISELIIDHQQLQCVKMIQFLNEIECIHTMNFSHILHKSLSS